MKVSSPKTCEDSKNANIIKKFQQEVDVTTLRLEISANQKDNFETLKYFEQKKKLDKSDVGF